jgi:hypothetical protein
MDIAALPAKWRKQADDQPYISSNDVDIRLTLRNCAHQLELALHQERHDGEFKPGCQFCTWERINNDTYPEPSS